MTQNDRLGRDRADEVEQFLSIRMRRQVVLFHATFPSQFAPRGAEEKRLTFLGGAKPACGCGWIRIAHKKDGMFLLSRHAQSQFVRGRVLIHHPCR